MLFQTDHLGRYLFLSGTWERLSGYTVDEMLGTSAEEMIRADTRDAVRQFEIAQRAIGQRELHLERLPITCRDGSEALIDVRAVRLVDADGNVMRDTGYEVHREIEVRHAQKLEAVGRLAAGIAHEINTPVQFVGDNLRFLSDSFVSVLDLLERYRASLNGAGQLSWSERRDLLRLAEADADVEYLAEEVPIAVDQSLEGIQRVASIVRAMKAFGHPDRVEQHDADLNEALANTLTVARNELKYVADVNTDYGDIPRIRCHPGDINQVFLNLLVNAAHAIAAIEPERGRGTIAVRTWLDGNDVCISVADSGTGVPAELQERIFDPFFTTKDVGQGTGQGLSLARAVIVEKHAGTLSLRSTPGEGATFTIRLPVAGTVGAGSGSAA